MSASKPAKRTKRQSTDLDLLLKLLAIPGASCEEANVADFVSSKLVQAGAAPGWLNHDAAHRKTPVLGEVGNLTLKLPGTTRGPRRMLVAHLDTVPLCVGCKPIRKGNLIRSAVNTGLGADNRAGCAVLLSTALHLLRHRIPHPPLTFLWTVQEEIGLQGVRNLNLSKLGRPKLAFNWDGGNASKLTIGATGGYRMEIEITGLASHAGGAPEKGISAITIASLAIADLHQQGYHGLIQDAGHTGTSNIGVINGGNATNVVADAVTLKAEARSHQAGFRQKIVRRIEQAFRRAAKHVKNHEGKAGQVRIEGRLDYEAFCLPTNHPCVQAAQAAVRQIGNTPELAIANGGLDANWLTARGIPTVSLGCGQLHQHTVKEALDIRQFQDACRIALALATGSHD